MSGPEVCRTEYISECWTRNEPHQVVDDVPKCRTEYEEKCEYTQVSVNNRSECQAYSVTERLRDGPEVQQVAEGGVHHRQGVQVQGIDGADVMTHVSFHFLTLLQANPVTKCEKIPQRLCGPAGCGFVPGPEQCHDEVKTMIQELPQEECDLTPQRKCK